MRMDEVDKVDAAMGNCIPELKDNLQNRLLHFRMSHFDTEGHNTERETQHCFENHSYQ